MTGGLVLGLGCFAVGMVGLTLIDFLFSCICLYLLFQSGRLREKGNGSMQCKTHLNENTMGPHVALPQNYLLRARLTDENNILCGCQFSAIVCIFAQWVVSNGSGHIFGFVHVI